MDISYYQLLCTLASEAMRIPICFVTDKWEVVNEEDYVYNPLYESFQTCLNNLSMSNTEKAVTLHATKYLENYLSIRIPECEGYLIIGPTIYPSYVGEQIKSHLKDSYISINRQEVLEYYEKLTCVSKPELIACANLLYLIIYGENLSDKTLSYAINIEPFNILSNPTETLTKQHFQQAHNHHNLLLEKRILNAIRTGNAVEVKQAILEFPEELYGVLSKQSHLRSYKNIVITAITLATRSAIEGGLESEIALTLSDLYIQKLEELLFIEEVKVLHLEALCRFAECVSEVKKGNYSRTILSCMDYINQHLYESITLNQLAEATNKSPNYLSSLFKKEVGMSPINYIILKKVEEAKELLLVTDASLLEICLYLGFHDQSYFTKVFKKHTGQTPRQFRQKPLEGKL